jgi:hypothetical protein
MATLLCTLLEPKGPGLFGGMLRLVVTILSVGLMLTTPALLAAALTAASQGESGGAAAALYGLGVVVWLYLSVKAVNKDEPGSLDGQSYDAWLRLSDCLGGDWTTTGAGAKAYLEDMMRRGLRVPVVAIDTAAALQANTLGRHL